jgi:hypothetical protein
MEGIMSSSNNTIEAVKSGLQAEVFKYQPSDEFIYPRDACPAQGGPTETKGYFHCKKLNTLVTGRVCTFKCCGLSGFVD